MNMSITCILRAPVTERLLSFEVDVEYYTLKKKKKLPRNPFFLLSSKFTNVLDPSPMDPMDLKPFSTSLHVNQIDQTALFKAPHFFLTEKHIITSAALFPMKKLADMWVQQIPLKATWAADFFEKFFVIFRETAFRLKRSHLPFFGTSRHFLFSWWFSELPVKGGDMFC